MFNLFLSLSRSLRLTCATLCIGLSIGSISDAQAQLAQETEINALLAKADLYRMPAKVAKSITRVELFEQNQLSSESLYHVYSQTDKRSLVVFKSDAERGQKMLMLQDHYWLLMPNSKRPIRITPMQKLLGQASVGDISTMTWSQDYEVIRIEADQDQLKLALQSKTTQSNYQRIELWLQADTAFPVRANLYLKSGKLAKTAYFESDTDLKRVQRMRLVDAIQPEKVTLIHYDQHEPIALEEKFYNPAYLVRQNLSDF